MSSVKGAEPRTIQCASGFRYRDMPKVTYGIHYPLFIIGAPRSGTSMLVRLIRKYFNINFGTEGQFIVRFYKRLPKFGDLSDPQNMDHLIAQIANQRCFGRWKQKFGFSLDCAQLKRDIRVPTYRGLLDAIFQQFAAFAGRARWGDKYPGYTLDLPILDALYPEAQYIHIIRDGRDVASSLQHTPFGPKNFLQAAFYWKRYVMPARNLGQRICPSRFHEIRYEVLLQDPVHVLTGLAEFLQIQKGFQEVITRIKQQIHEDLKRDNGFKWKKELRSSQIRLFEKGAGDLLQTLGYEVLFSNRKQPTPLEKVISYIDSQVRQQIKTFWIGIHRQ